MRSSIFRKKEPAFSYDQAVLIEILFDGFDDFGTSDEQDQVYALEDRIYSLLPNNAGIDGHEFGEGTCTIYIYGPSADQIFRSIESQLKLTDFRHINITLQYGDAEDPETKDIRFSL